MVRIRADHKGVIYAHRGTATVKLRANDLVPDGVSVDARFVETPRKPEFPGSEATRSELDAYAKSVGIDPRVYKTKGALLEALS